MANKSINQLPGAAVVATDEYEKQVTGGGASQKNTATQLLTFIQNNATAFTQATVAFSNAITAGGGLFNVNASGETHTPDLTVGTTELFNTGAATFASGVFLIAATGDIEITDTTKGLILKSPNGTRYRLQVDNAGNLGTVPA